MTMIELPDNQAAALKAKAAMQGLTLKALAWKAGRGIVGRRAAKAP